MSDVVCPRCGATGHQGCSTASGRDHAARVRAEIAMLKQPSEESASPRPVTGQS